MCSVDLEPVAMLLCRFRRQVQGREKQDSVLVSVASSGGEGEAISIAVPIGLG